MNVGIARQLVVATFVAGVAGCSTGAGGAARVDGPVLTSGPGSGEEYDALVKGTIVLDAPCLLLESEGGRYPVVWPSGTRWQSDPPAVRLPGGIVPIGGRVSGGGGYFHPENLRWLPREVVDAAAACAGSTRIAVFNPGSEVTIASR